MPIPVERGIESEWDESQGGDGPDQDAWWVDQRVDWIPMGTVSPDPPRHGRGVATETPRILRTGTTQRKIATEIKQAGYLQAVALLRSEQRPAGQFPNAVDFHASGWLDWDQFIKCR